MRNLPEQKLFSTPPNRLTNQSKSSILKFYESVCIFKEKKPIETFFFVIVSLPLTLFIYFWNSFQFSIKFNTKEDKLTHDVNDELIEMKTFQPKISSSNKETTRPCNRRFGCKLNFDFVVPNNPFAKTNRLLTCIIYTAYIHSILNIFKGFDIETSQTFFESLLLKNKTNLTDTDDSSLSIASAEAENFLNKEFFKSGIFGELVSRILYVFTIGIQYYPILLCGELKRKSKLTYFVCCVYSWLMFSYFVLSNELCNCFDEKSPVELITLVIDYFREILMKLFSKGLDSVDSNNYEKAKQMLRKYTNKDLKQILKNKSSGMANNSLFKKFTYLNISDTCDRNEYENENLMLYAIQCLIAVTLSMDFFIVLYKQLKENVSKIYSRSKKTKIMGIESDESFETICIQADLNYTLSRFREKKKYVSSGIELISSNIYRFEKCFRFSKQILTLKTISVVLLICLTIKIVNLTLLTSKIIAFVIDTLLELFFPQVYEDENVSENIKYNTDEFIKCITIACVLTTSVYIIQMLLSIRNHQMTVLKAYSGKFNFYTISCFFCAIPLLFCFFFSYAIHYFSLNDLVLNYF